jgi:hypothetical protein
MNLGTASGLTLGTFPMPLCYTTSTSWTDTRIPNFLLRNRLTWQRLFNVNCNQFNYVSNFH